MTTSMAERIYGNKVKGKARGQCTVGIVGIVVIAGIVVVVGFVVNVWIVRLDLRIVEIGIVNI